MTHFAARPDRTDRLFFRLAGMELWERFSLHGMKALLTLYLINEVLAPNKAVPWGLAALRHGLEGIWGLMTPLAFASQVFGLYAALAYLALPFGGLIGDRVIGRRDAVLAGAVAIAAGHACLTVPALLLPALALLIAGTGLLKANLAAQVSDLFPATDPRRGTVFARYLACINVGTMLGPLVCGWLAQQFGWAYGFAGAGVAMLAGLAVFVGMPTIAPVAPSQPAPDPDHFPQGSIGAAVGAIIVTVLGFSAYEQVWNLFLVWIERTIRLDIGGFAIPPAWFLTADGLLTILMVIATIRVGRLARLRQGDRLVLGCGAIVLGYAMLSLFSMVGLHSITAPLTVLAFLDFGIALLWPAAVAIVTSATPRRMEGALIGIFYLHGFFANLVVGVLGALYDRMPTPLFWLCHAGVASLAAGVAIPTRRSLRRNADRPI
ncbi:MFS transporter [Sphingomonas populi]|uniref:MFS transporter n=1 Tax=Sphingomonas populi TaxID=2484750 RepID=A0A4Q6XX79_9SPHN|nr:MFS transporter [Sphingomonas populi]RZF61096.1 MFS transporter [Sphingomonas populi]